MLHIWILGSITIVVAAIIIAAVWKLLVPAMRQMYLTVSGPRHFRKEIAKQGKKDIMPDTLEKALQACELEEVKGIKIRPCYIVENRTDLGFGTAPKCLKLITYSAVWIELLASGVKEWKIAFLHSVGHELAHRTDIPRGLAFIFWKKENRKLFYWLREVRNDLEGMRFMAKHFKYYEKEEILAAIQLKADKYESDERNANRKNPCFKHPAWSDRTYILNNCDSITNEVVDYLAQRAKCHDDQFIEKMKKMYRG